MMITDLKKLIFENFYNQLGFTEEDSNYSLKEQRKKYLVIFASKLTKKIPDPSTLKEHYYLSLKKKGK